MAASPPHATPHPPATPILDRIGATGSLLCAVHCAALPLIIALLPSLGLAAWLDDDFELGFVLFASALGFYSLIRGYRRHGVLRALRLLVPGLVALWLGVLYAPLHASPLLHAVSMTIGGTLVGVAHVLNLRLQNRHDATCCTP
ncbi:MerC domain-containing protein [Lysobacter sp. TY2-98]|uniref:MerC domain-containing protein n=1 Tax=Lysobacter sp. TY2-98 TaxID=2290922 RepID=UPI000E208BFF|nr:MerC domain-containing protein [Lysobacter sp. TY2-98]AXK72482.1 MerC domain-containing protein [Lysobacter sp. TY2-98]